MLEVKQVSKLYENKRGVHNIEFSMSRGEIVGFLGPNGAGKTTTMRMITGYLNPTKGSITVDGLSMADHPRKARRKIGYLPETPPLYPELSVEAYLKFIANLRDVPAREQKARIAETIGKLGLQGREKQIIRSLSKGYKQRVGLAQAILHKPDLLILDEPTSGLDPKQIIEIRDLIRELGENHTVLLSTHILPEVNAICNRVLIINQGRVVLDEKPENLGSAMGQQFELRLEVKGPAHEVRTELKRIDAVAEIKLVNEEAPAGLPGLLLEEPEAAGAGAIGAGGEAAGADRADAGGFGGTAAADADGAGDAAQHAIAADAAQRAAVAHGAAGTSTAASASTTKLLVTAKDRTDIREDVFFTLARAGYPILEMKRESLSLEDIFLKLTTEEPGAAERAAGEDEEVEDDA
ncbi:ABC transporter ATP-binding protein [Paenibacillus chartarius]|uniref:ABC transporter ATP-binding protein n=1 Tax=Paenibacillus chartarius TaxID=747481 RepID=A0ABV6DEE4_9BACL